GSGSRLTGGRAVAEAQLLSGQATGPLFQVQRRRISQPVKKTDTAVSPEPPGQHRAAVASITAVLWDFLGYKLVVFRSRSAKFNASADDQGGDSPWRTVWLHRRVPRDSCRDSGCQPGRGHQESARGDGVDSGAYLDSAAF